MICLFIGAPLLIGVMLWFLFCPPKWYTRWEDKLISKTNVKRSWLA